MTEPYTVIRRDIEFGEIETTAFTSNNISHPWDSGKPTIVRGVASSSISDHQGWVDASQQLYLNVLKGISIDELLYESPYRERIEDHFYAMGTSINPMVKQEIETVFYDACNGDKEVIAEDLWVKASWLSHHENDNSLRFRFSFGIDHEEDVAADYERELLAAKLADLVFPESALIDRNPQLVSIIEQLTQRSAVDFVERIVYFNAPNGGAYLHHDLERGHAGVVYLQTSGKTLWLALDKQSLLSKVHHFIVDCADKNQWPEKFNQNTIDELDKLIDDKTSLNEALDSFDHDALIQLINETPAFTRELITSHGYVLHTGDAILLPQQTNLNDDTKTQNCCWHSVFCLGNHVGEGLSFAIRC